MVLPPLATALAAAPAAYVTNPSASVFAGGFSITDDMFEAITATDPSLFKNGLGAVPVNPNQKTTFKPILPTVLVASVTAAGVRGGAVTLLIEVGLEPQDIVTLDYSNPSQGLNILYQPKGSTTPVAILAGGAGTTVPAALLPNTGMTFRIHGFRPEAKTTTGSTGSAQSAGVGTRLAGGVVRLTQVPSTVALTGGEASSIEAFQAQDLGVYTVGQTILDQLVMVASNSTATYTASGTAVAANGDSLTEASTFTADATHYLELQATVFLPPFSPAPPAQLQGQSFQNGAAGVTWSVTPGTTVPKVGDGTIAFTLQLA
ncbi:MAG: hypothetical protein KGJ23_08240 [Euryarchaeota archaeon]|nr:hypothetical protein [Euryarchaeota archaeon]MDE1836591.1 hypothetical protein [Euryarchaeota archaeon]MDE1879214.1 hypothetical protein [Euryarchaeota archaeon]MDE2044561.1 hypothetical protein [Thermoplasmata archaeon]